jgi:hypothetical protein
MTSSEEIQNMSGVWERLRVAVKRRAGACIQAACEHMEHLL